MATTFYLELHDLISTNFHLLLTWFYFIEIHNVFCLISVLLHLIRLVLWPNIWSIWTIFLMYLRRICILLLLYISILCGVFMHGFNSKWLIDVTEIFCFFIDFVYCFIHCWNWNVKLSSYYGRIALSHPNSVSFVSCILGLCC